jgi:hypothetical protein
MDMSHCLYGNAVIILAAMQAFRQAIYCTSVTGLSAVSDSSYKATVMPLPLLFIQSYFVK